MSHKKAGGSTKNGRDSIAKRLGVKIFGGQFAKAGAIIVRQRGNKFFAGDNVGTGKDHTLYALSDGFVEFTEKKLTKYDGRVYKDKFVHIRAHKAIEKTPAPKPKKVTAKKAEPKTTEKATKKAEKEEVAA